jgi:hypothetical protein
VTANAVSTVDVSVGDPYYTYVDVGIGEPATFPNAVNPKFSVRCAKADGHGSTVPVRFDQPRAVSVHIWSRGSDCSWATFHDAMGERGVGTFRLDPKQNVTLRTKRLEVDHVTLTDEAPGTIVPGEYQVKQHGSTVAITSQWLPTRTGLDLPAGGYHVTTRYKSPQGHPRQIEQDVTLQ